jgi:hypothetical protein
MSKDFKINFKLFQIKEGKFKILPSLSSKNIKGFFIASIVLIIITSLTGWLKLDQKDLWKLYNLLILRFDLKNELPDLRDNEKKLEAEIEVEVDRAIREYEKWESSIPPRMTNKVILEDLKSPKFSDTQRLVVKDAIYYECPGGVMGIRAVWVDKDPECN